MIRRLNKKKPAKRCKPDEPHNDKQTPDQFRYMKPVVSKPRKTGVKNFRSNPFWMLRDIKNGTFDPQDLSVQQRRALVMCMMDGKRTTKQMAVLLQVPSSTITWDLREIRAEVGREVAEWSTSDVLGYLMSGSERYQALALRQEEPGTAWMIRRDTIKLMKELGLVGQEQAPDGIRVIIEGIGKGYDRASKALAQAMDPVLTGEVIPTAAVVREIDADLGPRPSGRKGKAEKLELPLPDQYLEPGQ